MTWAVIGVGVGVVVGLAILVFIRRPAADSSPTGEQYMAMGAVFLAVGGGTVPTIGVGMLGMAAFGAILLVEGARRRAAERRDT